MAGKNFIRNTSAEERDNPRLTLLELMAFGTSGMIEAQESQGQIQLVNSAVLPSNSQEWLDIYKQTRPILESWGVVYGEPVEGDPLFVHVMLPDGWKKVATDHSMWSDLIDDKGRVRASIFYKAAFYDRGAHINACRRYTHSGEYDCQGNRLSTTITDGGKIIHSWPITDYTEGCAVAEAWLNEHYPDWASVTAYWEK